MFQACAAVLVASSSRGRLALGAWDLRMLMVGAMTPSALGTHFVRRCNATRGKLLSVSVDAFEHTLYHSDCLESLMRQRWSCLHDEAAARTH